MDTACRWRHEKHVSTGYERKYANRLLTGSRKFRERRGRGKTYGDDVTEVLKRVWREATACRISRRRWATGRKNTRHRLRRCGLKSRHV